MSVGSESVWNERGVSLGEVRVARSVAIRAMEELDRLAWLDAVSSDLGEQAVRAASHTLALLEALDKEVQVWEDTARTVPCSWDL